MVGVAGNISRAECEHVCALGRRGRKRSGVVGTVVDCRNGNEAVGQ